jgi:hypothetical protein
MALDWYRTSEWSEEDEERLKRRMASRRKYYDRAFALRVKANLLAETGDSNKVAVAERLLRMIVEDPELELARTNHAIACEVSSAFDALGRMADRAGDPILAEQCFRQGQSYSLTPGTGLTLALHLSRSDDPRKLDEASRLLDEVEATKTPPQLLFARSRICYSVARARICAKRGEHIRAAEFARAALGVAQFGPIDSFKRKPMDDALLDTDIAAEMLALQSFQKEEIDNPPNKAPEPTTRSVTPRATEAKSI